MGGFAPHNFILNELIMLYEIHVTVETDNIEQFVLDCKQIGVKPIVIETERNNVFGKQVMTSSKHSGDSYKNTLTSICKQLEVNYKIVRQKVEIFPEDTKHPDHIYYESHIRLKLKPGFDRTPIEDLCDMFGFHMSKNLFKKDDNFVYQMITYRSNGKKPIQQFDDVIDAMVWHLSSKKIEFDKVEIEECIFDTNVSIDNKWLD